MVGLSDLLRAPCEDERAFPVSLRGFSSFFISPPSVTDALSAPSGATTSTGSPQPRNLAQVICTKLLRTPLADIAEAAGCDVSGASRIRANERPCTLNAWLRVMDRLGYKLVSKGKLCMPQDEARMLRRAYAFITSSDELSTRFAASEESVPLDWDGDE